MKKKKKTFQFTYPNIIRKQFAKKICEKHGFSVSGPWIMSNVFVALVFLSSLFGPLLFLFVWWWPKQTISLFDLIEERISVILIIKSNVVEKNYHNVKKEQTFPRFSSMSYQCNSTKQMKKYKPTYLTVNRVVLKKLFEQQKHFLYPAHYPQ